MRTDEYCKILCQVKLNGGHVAQFKRSIDEAYHHNWIVDNIPAASVIDTEAFVTTSYSRGFPVGYYDRLAGKHYLYNHANIVVEYHEAVPDGNRIVGFYVEPFSVDHKFVGGTAWSGNEDAPALETCSIFEPMDLDRAKDHGLALTKSTKVLYTYDIVWKPSNIKWASRWDIYLSMDNAVPKKVHWFSIVNSLMIVICLSGMIAMILARNLRRDISQYNRVPTDDDDDDGDIGTQPSEETGWKLVHQDVFRPPKTLPMLLCVFVGSGVQVLVMALATIAFAAVGFISPANRGSLMFVMLLLFVLMGAFAGYHCARLYKSFKGQRWQRATVATALLFPGGSFFVFFGLDLTLASYEGSTGAVPITTLLALLALWFGISVPLVFLGAYLGFRKEPLEFPAKFSNIPRLVPTVPWYLSTTFTVVIGGVLPFGACFVELFFILSSMWMDQYYYVFGFTFLVFAILIVTCAEITMVLLYFQLCAEDYHWWWRSFLTSGSTAAYVFLYSSFYFSKLESNLPITYFLYFGYMGIISFGIFLFTGTVGFFAALWFNVVIFGSIKVD
jgi:transmembrane 9 superfamily protein 2/4